MEAFHFSELIDTPEVFFSILPLDWQTEIAPYWKNHKQTASIYVIEKNQIVIGGGIVFYQVPPNFEYFEEEAQSWFENGFYYLGFIFISPEHRNQNLGTYWLQQLRLLQPKQRYFLLTEEVHLQHFYEKNNFHCVKSINNDGHQEWLFADKGVSS